MYFCLKIPSYKPRNPQTMPQGIFCANLKKKSVLVNKQISEIFSINKEDLSSFKNTKKLKKRV